MPEASEQTMGAQERAGERASEPAQERRESRQRQRASDRLFERATGSYEVSGALRGVEDVENLLLFLDDDLRETALAMGKIEGFLVRTLGLLAGKKIQRESIHGLASDTRVLDDLDAMNEGLESLRRRLATLALRLG